MYFFLNIFQFITRDNDEEKQILRNKCISKNYYLEFSKIDYRAIFSGNKYKKKRFDVMILVTLTFQTLNDKNIEISLIT